MEKQEYGKYGKAGIWKSRNLNKEKQESGKAGQKGKRAKIVFSILESNSDALCFYPSSFSSNSYLRGPKGQKGQNRIWPNIVVSYMVISPFLR